MSFLTLLLLVIAFILSALTYYKLNPERVVVSIPFLFMATPLVLFVAVLAMSAGGTMPTRWSAIALLVALVMLVASIWRARWLLPKGR